MLVKIKPTKKLDGQIKISGSKNSCLPILAISLLTNKKMILNNVPMISDIYDMMEILKELGIEIKCFPNENKLILKRKRIKNELLIDEISKIRASYYVIPGMIGKHNNIKIKYPGGCNFMNRPIDFHILALEKSGSIVIEKENIIEIIKKKTKNNIYKFPKASVGATINSIMLSLLSKKTSKIVDQTIEPEIRDFINCLVKMGADIKINKNEIIVKGGKKLKSVTYDIMPDRIELGSYILLASSCNSNIELTNIRTDAINYLMPFLNKLAISYKFEKNKIKITGNSKINNIDLIVRPYPNFPTDLQQILCASLLNSNNESIIEDQVYPKRISHIKELNKMGANIEYDNESSKIKINKSTLQGANLYAHDLRCGFALILASLNANSESSIDNFQVVNRGYEDIISKLNKINIEIEILKK